MKESDADIVLKRISERQRKRREKSTLPEVEQPDEVVSDDSQEKQEELLEELLGVGFSKQQAEKEQEVKKKEDVTERLPNVYEIADDPPDSMWCREMKIFWK